ncbi:MAG: hypothetical protein ONB14_05700 [candidate division KSB1 bacterium]|nr:hypothetical protein [candidate division KSB1 bacterium]MDZ7378975.1 hypothetical protein [candidate division KSB1 bacterium]MDZ7386851.1 hypothetical protein [candidate division KSB1 bacterium]MDZ7393232.1 hypothetical protein [candidate division KSB1 bacterium]MDZ7412452.1 hypothetical protein [candidate division KSB1 bacterium]
MMMKKARLLQVGAVTVLAMATIMSCDKNPAHVVDRSAEEEAIRTIVLGDVEVFHEMGLDDGGAQPPSYEVGATPKAGDYIEPVRYGRRGKFSLVSVDIEFEAAPGELDTLAIATVTKTFTGTFVVVAKDSENTPPQAYKVYEKPIETTVVRKAKLRRVAYTDNPLRNWRIVQVSMSQSQSVPTTIDIARVWIEPPGQEPLVIADPLSYWLPRHIGLPLFSAGDTVKVYVSLTNSNSFPPPPGTTVLVHFGVDRGLHRARHVLNDQGAYPDQVAGDGVFSGCWVAKHDQGLRHLLIDAIDNGTIYDDAAPYNSVQWGMVYGRR